MRILIIKSENSIVNRLYQIASVLCERCELIPEPDENLEVYLATVLNAVRAINAEYIFSVNFYPSVSLACGALKIRYVSWIIDGTADESYDYNIGNAWNTVLTSDYSLYKRLSKCCPIKYYPLGYTVDNNEINIEKSGDYDLLFWSNTSTTATFVSDALTELKDSTKGYIDSMVEQRKNDLRSWDLYERFADYIISDIDENYPLSIDSYETIPQKYDRLYFIKMLENTYSYPYIHFLSSLWPNKGKVQITSDNSELLANLGVNGINKDSIIEMDYKPLGGAKIVVIFPEIVSGNSVSIDVWNMMIKGKFIMLPEWISIDEIVDAPFVKFRNKREMYYKARYYAEHDDERIEIAMTTRNYAVKNGSIDDRIKSLINSEMEGA